MYTLDFRPPLCYGVLGAQAPKQRNLWEYKFHAGADIDATSLNLRYVNYLAILIRNRASSVWMKPCSLSELPCGPANKVVFSHFFISRPLSAGFLFFGRAGVAESGGGPDKLSGALAAFREGGRKPLRRRPGGGIMRKKAPPSGGAGKGAEG